ncbi:MAG: cation diffusion facilitator family transporter [Chloroflexota bacterium]
MADTDSHDHDHDHDHRSGLRGFVGSLFSHHSHDAADSLDDALAGSQQGIRAVQVSLVGLGLTAGVQIAVVMLSGSVALLADAIHNVADAFTAVPLWIAFWLGTRAPTRRYPYGYGRIEDLAGVVVVLMIAGSSAVAAWESIQRLLQPQTPNNLVWVAAAGAVGFIGNEAVAQYRIRTGERIGSAALVTDGYHARVDGFTSLAVVLGARRVLLGFAMADVLVGLGITVAILIVLKAAAHQIWQRLMDAIDPDVITQAARAAGSADGVQEVSLVRARWIGHRIHAEALIVADSELSLSQAHAIAERARHAMLHAVPKLATVTVHVDPISLEGDDHHAAVAHHTR